MCFNTAVDTVKGRILRRTGYAVLTVQDDRPPFSYLTVEGPVELVDDLDEVRRWATTIGGRYMGADRAEELGADGYLYGHVAGESDDRIDLVARVDGRNHPNAGDVVTLVPEPRHLHLFDSESGERLTAPVEA